MSAALTVFCWSLVIALVVLGVLADDLPLDAGEQLERDLLIAEPPEGAPEDLGEWGDRR